MESGNLLSAARHWWWTVVLATILAGFAGQAFSSSLPATYESRVRLLVGPVAGEGETLRAAGQLTRTYAELVTSSSVIGNTIDELGLPHSPAGLVAAVRPTSDSATRMLILRVRDSSPEGAANIANELAAQLARLTGTAASGAEGDLLIIDAAEPGVPIGITSMVVVVLSGFAGLVVALTLALLLETMNATVRDEEELVEATGLDYLGVARRALDGEVAGQGFVVEAAPASPRAAEHRLLATKIELMASRHGARSLLVMGVGRSRAAGEVAANTAKVLAERRHCVTLVDGNPLGTITSLLGLTGRPGLRDLLDHAERTDDQVHPAPYTFSRDPRLFIVPAGTAHDRQASRTSGVPWLIEQLLKQADFLVVNAGSADRTPEALVWAGEVDATVLVVPRNRARRTELSHLVESLRLVGATPIGVVFEERSQLLPFPLPSWSTGGARPALPRIPPLPWTHRDASTDGKGSTEPDREEERQ